MSAMPPNLRRSIKWPSRRDFGATRKSGFFAPNDFCPKNDEFRLIGKSAASDLRAERTDKGSGSPKEKLHSFAHVMAGRKVIKHFGIPFPHSFIHSVNANPEGYQEFIKATEPRRFIGAQLPPVTMTNPSPHICIHMVIIIYRN